MNIDFNKIYRAVVIDNRDSNKSGRILCYIPDIQGDKAPSKSECYWALPSAWCYLGSTENKKCGQVLIPPKGSNVAVRFEPHVGSKNSYATGDPPGVPFYMSGIGLLDTQSKTVLPYENVFNGEYEKRYTLLKTPNGRAIILSDDSNNESIIIKGKDPGGRNQSTLVCDDDMAVILDEKTPKIRIQTGNKEQYIEINKKTNETIIRQGENTSIIMTNDSIKLKANRIDLN